MELIADCHEVTEVNLITDFGLCSMTSSIESLERLERAHGLVTPLSVHWSVADWAKDWRLARGSGELDELEGQWGLS